MMNASRTMACRCAGAKTAENKAELIDDQGDHIGEYALVGDGRRPSICRCSFRA